MTWVDAHTHLDDARFDTDRDAVVARAREVGIGGLVMCGADPAHWTRLRSVAQRHGAAWTIGIHPWWGTPLSDDAHDAWLDVLRATPTPHGIGETGLDHLVATTPEARARQVESTRAHLDLARSRSVPIVLHVVRAYPQLRALLRACPLPAAGGMIHAWSGPEDTLRSLLDLGVHVSIGAAVTRSPKVQHAARQVPDDRLLLETDAPDQPLEPDARGEPADLLRVAAHVAALRGTTAHHVLDVSAANARRLFPSLR